MNLTVIKQNENLVVDSREVAEMIGKRHSDLLESIDGYLKVIGQNGNFRSDDFFIQSSYEAGTGKPYKCYLLTKKGCDMVANKMTGEKGVLFTAAYVTKFEEMERSLKAPMQELSPQLQLLINMELEQKKLKAEITEAKEQTAAVKEEFQAVREVIEVRPSENWRVETNNLVKKICFKRGDYQKPKEELYKAVQERGACDLKRRLENKRARLILNGGSKSKADSLNYLDVIAEDKKLIEIYTAIVKEMAIKYKA